MEGWLAGTKVIIGSTACRGGREKAGAGTRVTATGFRGDASRGGGRW